MPDRLIARRGLAYPADAESLARVRAAGGLSRLSPAERARVRYKWVAPGEPCDDLPPESLPLRLARGDVERVAEPPAPLDPAPEPEE